DCLAVCPWNKFADTAATHRAFLPRAELAAPRLADLLDLDDAGFRALFAGSPIKRIGRNRMVRNAAIAAGNSGDAALIPALERGKFSRPVEPGRLGSYFERGSQVLAAHRWEGISTSHWRRTTRERNLYNLLVKTGASCLAFGSGAGGFLDGRSYRVDRDLGRYLATVAAGEAPVTHIMAQAPHHTLLNAIKGGMESGRLDIAQATAALAEIGGATIGAAIQPLLEQWRRAGLLRLSDGWLELTLAGRFWQVSMTQRLIEWINHNIDAGIPSARTLSTAKPTGETV
ncbi:MAG TPA: hypothetical protein PLG99_03205, partial [Kaistiaceae bacterium]|nr:hypothetical protein [Kaistiaceae bacterium]